jgi:VIT1/CCC1 family predicted Fe2+/Mn2+ transporter
MKRIVASQAGEIYTRNIIFGVEDGLVSTVGFLSGIASVSSLGGTVVITGIVLVFVEAFSMGIGSLLSEHSTEEFAAKKEVPFGKSFLAAAVMFVSYILAGAIPLIPYIFLPAAQAFWVSIAADLAAVVGLGWYSAQIAKVSPLRKILEMLFMTVLAISAGVFVARLVG